MSSLTHDRALDQLDFDQTTGNLRWKIARSGLTKGKVAGAKDNSTGYIIVGFDGEKYYAHRLIWFWMRGEWPGEVDHMNGDRSDNRWENLREATSSQNKWNGRIRRTNTSGFKGVHFHVLTGKWRARVKFHYKLFEVGLFDTPEEAHAAYVRRAEELHGEFARAA